MNKKTLVGYVTLAGIVTAFAAVGIYQGVLQSDLDANGHSITNIVNIYDTNGNSVLTAVELSSYLQTNGNGGNLTNIGTNAMSQAAHEFYAGGGSASSNTNGEWAIVGVGFDGGQNGWPPNYVDERGFLLMSTDGHHFNVSSAPQIIGVAGHLRDASVMAFSNYYACAYTTNSATNASFRFAITLSTNLAQWTHYSIVSPALSGETLSAAATPDARVWGPTLYDDGTNIHCFVAVTTNYATTRFDLRKMTTTRSAFPSGWSTATNLGNATAYTNLIEIAPVVDGAYTYAFVTGPELLTGNNVGRLMRFGDGNLTNLTLVNASPIGGWGGAVEGITAVRLWNNKIRLYWVFYNNISYGGFGDGHTTRYSDITSVAALDWTDPRQARFGGRYIQNFKPFVARTTPQIAQAVTTIAAAGNGGIVRVTSKQGDSPINGSIYRTDRSLNRGTNDFIHWQMGDDSWPVAGWFFGTNDVLKGYVAKFSDTGNANEVHDHGVTNWISVASNSITLHLPLSGEGSGLTNAGTMSANTNAFASLKDAAAIATALIPTSTSVPITNNIPITGWYPSSDAAGMVQIHGSALYSRAIVSGNRFTMTLPIVKGYRTNITRLFFATTNTTSPASISFGQMMVTNGTQFNLGSATTTAIPAGPNTSTNIVAVSYTNTSTSGWGADFQAINFAPTGNASTTYHVGGVQEWYP